MLLSNYFLPLLKEAPSDAQLMSHKLMLRSGMLRQEAAGLYTWLPLGLKILRKIEMLIREELEACGCIELLMPMIQPGELWEKTGRYEMYGQEMLRVTDRHNNPLVFAPTSEELMTRLLQRTNLSYRELPKNFYQIAWKFRDEVRPRHGVMRSREFLMKDGYSFDLSKSSALVTYVKMLSCYLRIFAKLGTTPLVVPADSGQIGGAMSHEIVLLAHQGETKVYYDTSYLETMTRVHGRHDKDSVAEVLEHLSQKYVRFEDQHDPEGFQRIPEHLRNSSCGIEVGHVFYLGEKYSKQFDASVLVEDGKKQVLHMGCFGIGIGRVVAALIEINHDERGIVWPESVAPFLVHLVGLDPRDQDVVTYTQEVYRELVMGNIPVLYDDLDDRPGVKFAKADLIGMPWQIIVSKKHREANTLEIRRRDNGETRTLQRQEALETLLNTRYTCC